MPEGVRPMMATSGPLPPDDGRWALELKWDGVRAIAYVKDGAVTLQSRSMRDITRHYPEAVRAPGSIAGRRMVLDGELVAYDESGRPSFQRLQSRMHIADPRHAAMLARDTPVHFVVFDVIWLDGESLAPKTYLERRDALAGLRLDDGSACWQVPGHRVGDGEALLAATRAQGLEGLVAKRVDCPYHPGRRSPGWVKVKNRRRATVVVGGWLPGEGTRSGRLGALVVGYHDDDGALHYAGRVGSGFNEAELKRLQGTLAPLARDASPFMGRQPPRLTRFVDPVLVADVEFSEWTGSRTLRAPSYKGLRDDLESSAVGFDPGD